MTNFASKAEQRRYEHFKKEKEVKFDACCLECNNTLQDTEIPDTKVCLNEKCEKYQVYVTDWFNFERW